MSDLAGVPRSRRRAVAWLSYLFVTSAAVVLILEAATRWLGLASSYIDQRGRYVADPYLPYRPTPGLAIRESTPEFSYELRHNARGFRDTDHVTPKPEGTVRILGLGDSFTYGVGAAFEDTYLAVLETLLQPASPEQPRVEVVKAGIPRFFAEPERILLEREGVLLTPDLVIVGFLPNDVSDTAEGLEAVTVSPDGQLVTREAAALGPVGLALVRHSHLARLVLGRVAEMLARRRSPVSWSDVFREGGFHEKDWRALEAQYRAIARLASAAGARMLILHIPQTADTRAHPEAAYPGERLRRFASANGIEFADALPALANAQAQGRGPLFWPRDGHCTPAGYRVLAEVLREVIVTRKLLPVPATAVSGGGK